MVFRLHHFILITLVRYVFLIALSLCISSPLLSWLTRCCLHNLCPLHGSNCRTTHGLSTTSTRLASCSLLVAFLASFFTKQSVQPTTGQIHALGRRSCVTIPTLVILIFWAISATPAMHSYLTDVALFDTECLRASVCYQPPSHPRHGLPISRSPSHSLSPTLIRVSRFDRALDTPC
jgi:hypothetical protein